MKCLRKLITALATLIVCVAMHGSSFHEDLSDQPYTFSLNVDLVVLDVSVQDSEKNFVSGLDSRHFQLYEDGQPQQLKVFQNGNVPVTVGLVVDSSGSMKRKRSEVVAAALAFVRALNPEDEVFVVNFNEHAELGLTQEEFTHDVEHIRQALYRAPTSGQTALYDALAVALKQLGKGKHSRKALLIVSDGGDNASHHRLNEVVTLTQESKAVVHSIVLVDPDSRDQNPRVLKKLAVSSGGRFFRPTSMEVMETLCDQVARDIRSQYVLGYQPSNAARDGTYRAIKVLVRAPKHQKLIARTREGYRAPFEKPIKANL